MFETPTHSLTTNQDIVNLAAMSLSAAPDLTETERATRFQTVVRGTLEFQPADMAQTVLASLILGHHLTVMDGFRDITCLTLTPAEAARARMVTVAQTKLVLQMLRELRIARSDVSTGTAPAGGEPAQEAAGDGRYEGSLAKFMTAYADTLATTENTDTLTPAAATRALEALSQVMSPALFAAPRVEAPVSVPVTGSRAQRRALMKRNGGFKRHG